MQFLEGLQRQLLRDRFTHATAHNRPECAGIVCTGVFPSLIMCYANRVVDPNRSNCHGTAVMTIVLFAISSHR